MFAARRAAAAACIAFAVLAPGAFAQAPAPRPQPPSAAPGGGAQAPRARGAPPTRCEVTGLTDGAGRPASSGPAGTSVVASGTLVGCEVAFACGGTIVRGGSPVGQDVRLTVPNLARLPAACTVTAYPPGGQPAQPPAGRPFTVVAAASGACQAISAAPASGQWGAMLAIAGNGLDQGCVAEFVIAGERVRFPVREARPAELRLQVAQESPLGQGRIFVVPASQQLVKGGMPSLAFEVTGPPDLHDCEAFDASPSSAKPGESVILTGKGMDGTCAVAFADTRGTRYPARTEKVSASRLRAFVPLMPAGAGKVSSKLEGQAKGSRAVDVLVGDAAPVLASVSPRSGKPGDTVILAGDGFFPPEGEIKVRVQYLASRFVDLGATVGSPRQLSVVLPDVFADLGTLGQLEAASYSGRISVYRRSPALSSAAVDFKMVQPTAPAAPPPSRPHASSPNDAGAAKPGYVYLGSPRCQPPAAGTPTLQSDAAGFFCCASSSQAQGGRCRSGYSAYPADCSNYCTGGTCLAELFREGCYQRRP